MNKENKIIITTNGIEIINFKLPKKRKKKMKDTSIILKIPEFIELKCKQIDSEYSLKESRSGSSQNINIFERETTEVKMLIKIDDIKKMEEINNDFILYYDGARYLLNKEDFKRIERILKLKIKEY